MITTINDFKLMLEGHGQDNPIVRGRIYRVVNPLTGENDEFGTDKTFRNNARLLVNNVNDFKVWAEDADGNDREWEFDLEEFIDETICENGNDPNISDMPPYFYITYNMHGETSIIEGSVLLDLLQEWDAESDGVDDFIVKITKKVNDTPEGLSEAERKSLKDWFETNSAADEDETAHDEDFSDFAPGIYVVDSEIGDAIVGGEDGETINTGANIKIDRVEDDGFAYGMWSGVPIGIELSRYADHLRAIPSSDRVLTAADFKIGDKIIYKHSDPTSKGNARINGSVVDHFGEGILVDLDRPIRYFDHSKNRVISASSFELYDGEDNPWGNFSNIEKA